MAANLSLHLDQDKTTYFAGEVVSGQLHVEVDVEVDVVELVVSCSWLLEGHAPAAGEPLAQSIPVERWACGQHSYPFQFQLPQGPVTCKGELFRVGWALEAYARLGPGGKATVTRDLEVRQGSPGGEAHEPTPDRSSATDLFWLGTIGGGVLVCIAGVTLYAGFGPPGWLFSACAALVGILLFLFGVRNSVAELRLGQVFVGLPLRAFAGDGFECLVRLTPRRDVVVKSITAEFMGSETASRSYRSGDETIDDSRSHTLLEERQLLFEGGEVLEGKGLERVARFRVPPHALPSLSLPNNQVRWGVWVRIEVQGWPDWEHLYLVHVQSAPPLAELDVHVTQRDAALSSFSVQPNQVCPLCRDGLPGSGVEELTGCAGCRAVMHRECMRELGGCPTRGCLHAGRRRTRGS